MGTLGKEQLDKVKRARMIMPVRAFLIGIVSSSLFGLIGVQNVTTNESYSDKHDDDGARHGWWHHMLGGGDLPPRTSPV